jgi:hypothetical protein
MSPPEPTMTGAGHIVDRIGTRVMIAVICDPCTRRARAVEDRKEYKKLFDNRIQFDSTMSQRAMVTDRRSERAHSRHNQSTQKQSPTRQRKQYEPN